jgi:hypothetical protein
MRQTRRTALGSLPSSLASLAASPLMAGDAPVPDQVMAAIERHRAAFAAFEAAPSEVSHGAAADAAEALASTVPTTIEGVIALLDHLRDFERLLPLDEWHDGLPDGFEAAVCESVRISLKAMAQSASVWERR